MKKIKGLLILLLTSFLVTFSILSTGAETYYEYYGYTYTIYNNTSISLAGWDNSSPNLVIPDKIDSRYIISVANNGLKDNAYITSVDFSKATHLKRIGMDAFSGCNALNQKVIFPESLMTVNDGAFQNCSSLPAVVVNFGLKEIPEMCFARCTSLNDVQLNNGLEKIQRAAFAYCTTLEYLEIPQSVSLIGEAAFYGDDNLTLGVWYGTAGYDYAVVHNIPYVLLDGVKLGDASGDGSVNINDVTMIQRYLAELETLEGIYLHAADANQDGTVDIADATALQMYIAEYDLPYPIDEVMTQ